MLIQRFRGKIHQVKVTEAQLNYVGSITIDENLMDAAGFYEGERVQIVNNNNGERFETYTIIGERGSGIICKVKPKIVFPDANNQVPKKKKKKKKKK